MGIQLQERAFHLLEKYGEYRLKFNKCFKDKRQRRTILASMPNEAEYFASVKTPYLSEENEDGSVSTICGFPLLRKDQEQHLFRKMNFLKYRANWLRKRIKLNAKIMDKFEADVAEIERIRNILISANLRLVISIIKKHSDLAGRFHERFSDGISYLYLAVDNFDYAYGFKFSTYATWALRRNFGYAIPHQRRYDGVVKPVDQEFLELVHGNQDVEKDVQAKEIAVMLNKLLATVDERTAYIIKNSAGIGCLPRTLDSIAFDLNITKERVRQVRLNGFRELQERAKLMYPALCKEAEEQSKQIAVHILVCPVCKGKFATIKPGRKICSRFCKAKLRGKESPKPTKSEMTKNWKRWNKNIAALTRKYGVNETTIKKWAMGYELIPFNRLEFGVL